MMNSVEFNLIYIILFPHKIHTFCSYKMNLSELNECSQSMIWTEDRKDWRQSDGNLDVSSPLNRIESHNLTVSLPFNLTSTFSTTFPFIPIPHSDYND